MGITWRTRKEVAFLNNAWAQKGELAIDEMVLNDNDIPGMIGGFYYLMDLQPLGGWKGNTWAILHTDFSDTNAWYYPTREAAESQWRPARKAAG